MLRVPFRTTLWVQNKLNGRIPPSLASAPNLSVLDISNNSLSGNKAPPPTPFTLCTSLAAVLSRNRTLLVDTRNYPRSASLQARSQSLAAPSCQC